METHPENYFGDGGAPLRILERIRARYPLSFHGVGLSLGSTDPLDRAHLHKLKALVDRFEPAFVSEHLSWSSVGGLFLNELLPLPYTPESLDHICARIDEIQNVLQQPLLVENITRYLTWQDSTIPEGEFMATVSRRTGCGILLDLNNVYVNAANFHLDPFEFLDAIPAEAVWEIHLAGFDRFGRWLIDTHGERVYPEVWGLYKWAIHHFGPRPTLIEWDTNMPPLSVLVDQAKQADAMLARIIHDGSSRNRAVAKRDGHAEPWGLTPFPASRVVSVPVRTAGASLPAGMPPSRMPACRSGESTIAAELLMNNARQEAAMLRLREIQQAFAEGILDGKYHVVADAIVPGGSALRNVALYRRLIRTNYTQVLSVTYPVIRRLVGPRYFDLLARGYLKRYPSMSGDLFWYGRHLAVWLLQLQVPPLLVELARLEWACHEVYPAADSLPLPHGQLDAIATTDPSQAILSLCPAVRLLRLSQPVHRVWLALQPGAPTDSAVDLPLPENEICIVVTRTEGRTRVATLADLDYRLLVAMADQKTVAEVEQMARESDPEFDFARFMASLLDLNLLCGVFAEVRS
jgi:uncharacterized protein (UPF0276 family)